MNMRPNKLLIGLFVLLLIITGIEIIYYVYVNKANLSVNTIPTPEVNTSRNSPTIVPDNLTLKNGISTFLSSYVPMQDMTISMVVRIEEKVTRVISYDPFTIKYDFATNPNEKDLEYTTPAELKSITGYYLQQGDIKQSIKPDEIKEGDRITNIIYFNPLLHPTDKGYIEKIEIIKG